MKLPKLRLPPISWRRVTAGRALPWALAVVFLATTLTNWWLLRSDRHDDARVQEVEAVATSVLTTLTNYSPSTIDQDVRRLSEIAIGVFAAQVKQEFGSATIQKIKKGGLRGTGRVSHVFVESLSGNSATVFAVVAATRAGPAPFRGDLRFDVEMIETIDGWRVSNLTLFPTANLGSTVPGGTG